MENQEKKSSKLFIVVAIVIIICAVVGMVVCIMLNNKSVENVRNTVITKENYDEVLDEIDDKLQGSDDIYHVSYAIMYYIMQDGLNGALDEGEDADNDDAMYVNIYGKSVQTLIDEGKQLMEDNNITIEEFAASLEQLDDIEE